MRYVAKALILTLLLTASPSALAAPTKANTKLPEELILSDGDIIEVKINGRPTRLEVRPDAFGRLMINPAVAAELGLKPPTRGSRNSTGPGVLGNTGVHKVDFASGPGRKRIFWFNRNVSPVADGVISPASLPYKRVTFRLQPAKEGEKIYSFPLDRKGPFGLGGVGTRIKFLEEKIDIIFSLHRDENLVAAPTGNWLAENFMGAFTGAPKPILVYFDVEIPSRAMTLKQPLAVGELILSKVNVRNGDFGNADGIVDAAEPGPAEAAAGDRDEIVVIGKKKKDIKPRLIIGRAALQNCSALTYDLDKDEIRLSCLGSAI